MSSASHSLQYRATVRGRSGGLGIITLTMVLVAAARALWLLGSGRTLPPSEFVVLTSLALLFGILAHDQRRAFLQLNAQDLEIGHGALIKRLALTTISALSLRITGGRYADRQLMCWDRDGIEAARVSLQPFRRADLRQLIIQMHHAYPNIHVDHELTHYLQLDRTQLSFGP